MTDREILKCENAQQLLRECNLTVAQVFKNIDADRALNSSTIKATKLGYHTVETVKWFCKNVLLFNNFGQEVLR